MELPDINVLIALFDPKHVFHEPAHLWFAGAGAGGWETCPLTENGFIRIVSNPGYSSPGMSAAGLGAAVRSLFAAQPGSHQFWADDVSLCDAALFDLGAVHGPRQLTDLYLLGMCIRRGASLVTFDTGVQRLTPALKTPRRDLVRLLLP
jgi:toxin-antitoxin system PIN domain toxin